jgi:hypothetical protein
MPHPVGTVVQPRDRAAEAAPRADAAAQHDDGIVATGRRCRGWHAPPVFQRRSRALDTMPREKTTSCAIASPAIRRRPRRRRPSSASTAPATSPAVKRPIGDAKYDRNFRTMKLITSPRRFAGYTSRQRFRQRVPTLQTPTSIAPCRRPTMQWTPCARASVASKCWGRATPRAGKPPPCVAVCRYHEDRATGVARSRRQKGRPAAPAPARSSPSND